MNDRLPLFSIALLSAAALATELFLIRLFSIIQWHHAAYMIISLALLGYGVSGTLLAITRRHALQRFGRYYPALIALFSVSLPLCIWLAQRLDFNAESMLWHTEAWLDLMFVYLILTLPFLFAATAIGLALDRASARAYRLYAADLIGAGAGALSLVAVLSFFSINTAPAILTSLGLLALIAALIELRLCAHKFIPFIIITTIIVWLLPGTFTQPYISEFKPYNQALRVKGAQLVQQKSGPLGLLSVVENNEIPLRFAPGLSLYTPELPGKQTALFEDAANMSAVIDMNSQQPLGWLKWLPSALPYFLQEPETILILGAGGGIRIIQALELSNANIDVVEPNTQRLDLLGNLSGIQSTRVRTHVADGREFLQRSDNKYDLIILGVDSAGSGTSGLHALDTQFLHTVEAYQEYLDHLSPAGRINVTGWLQLPPREIFKNVTTAVTALTDSGNSTPENSLIVLRSLQTTSLLFGPSPYTRQNIDRLKEFSRTRGFDIGWYPDMTIAEANKYNRLPKPWLYEGIKSLSGNQSEQFIGAYKFNIRHATDDRPYAAHYFRWSLLDEIISKRGKGGMSLVEGGYLVLIATLIQAIVAGLLLILLPLLIFRHHTGTPTKILLPTSGYFICLGLAFLLIEISFIERLTLVLGHPLYSVSVALTGFLVFAGIGSSLTEKLVSRLGRQHTLWLSTGFILGTSILYLLADDWLFQAFRSLPDLARLIAALLLIAPLAIPMGIPFPLGLNWLASSTPSFLPWAWGLNGFASVVSAVLAILLAIEWGFNSVMMIASGLYILSALLLSKAVNSS